MDDKYKLSRRQFIRQAGTLGLAFTGTARGMGSRVNLERKTSRPNFVFILTDDQAHDAIGLSKRYPFLKTPNMDKLAQEGAWFENAFVTTSLCSPSRACFMTGCYAHRNKVIINAQDDPEPSVPLVSEVLRANGYQTAFIGKWHMEKHAQPRRGFDYWLSFKGQGEYTDPQLNENGRSFTEKGYITDILTDYACRWLSRPRSKPFCLFVWHKAVHSPFTPAPRHSLLYPDLQLEEPPNFKDDYKGKPRWLRRGLLYGLRKKEWQQSGDKAIPQTVPPGKWNPKNARFIDYFRDLSAVDESIGTITNTLKTVKQLDNTAVIFAGDNGFMMRAHQSRIDKRVMWEESIRIPLIIRYPKLVKAGSRIREMVLNIDVAPTMLDLAGVDIAGTMQGVSFAPLLAGRQVPWRDCFLYEYFQEKDFAPGIVTMHGVRTQRYKYIHYPELKDDIDELYDLANDPLEMKNLFSQDDHKKLLKEMQQRLKKLKKQYGLK